MSCSRVVRFSAVVALSVFFGVVTSAAFAQAPGGAGQGPMPPRRGPGGPGTRTSPRRGPTPLPILPALASYDDTSFYAKTDVPHGKVEQVTYKNWAGQEKRMHVYLPPSYEKDASAKFPVLYLNHGGGENDSHWSSTDRRSGGSAQFILDNLIAAGKARPMIIAMPNTNGIASATPPAVGEDDACTKEIVKDIIPFIDSHYRTIPSREGRAIAGLSMGGFVVMNAGFSHPELIGEMYVYSSGYFPENVQKFEERFKSLLEDPKLNAELLRVPVYIAEGETDIALVNGMHTMAVLNKYGVRNFWTLSTGGHEWTNWRRYLNQTAQIMFPADAAK